MSRKSDVFQLDDNDAPDANTSDAVGWSRDDGLGYRILIGNPDTVSNVTPSSHGVRGDKDDLAGLFNLDFCSVVADDAVWKCTHSRHKE